MRRAYVAAALALAFLPACSDGRKQGAPGEPPLRTVAPGPAEGVHPVPWTSAVLVSPDTVDVQYVGGATDCDVLADVRTAESPAGVTVTLYAGRRPADGEPCFPAGTVARTRVTLPSPLGDRPLLDGSASPPQRRDVRR